MNFISEQKIDQATDQLESNLDQTAFFEHLGEEQPILLAFLVAEEVDVLTEAEQQLMYLLAAIIYKAIEAEHPDCPLIDEEILGAAEEKNWGILEDNVRGTFSERITPFFNQYPQEDLLAFLEDALVFDEESEVTNEGRPYIFVILKTMIDGFIVALREEKE
jgi:hypothetical protein